MAQAIIYFKDGTQSIAIPGGFTAAINVTADTFTVQDAGTPVASTLAIAPLTNVEYVAFS